MNTEASFDCSIQCYSHGPLRHFVTRPQKIVSPAAYVSAHGKRVELIAARCEVQPVDLSCSVSSITSCSCVMSASQSLSLHSPLRLLPFRPLVLILFSLLLGSFAPLLLSRL